MGRGAARGVRARRLQGRRKGVFTRYFKHWGHWHPSHNDRGRAQGKGGGWRVEGFAPTMSESPNNTPSKPAYSSPSIAKLGNASAPDHVSMRSQKTQAKARRNAPKYSQPATLFGPALYAADSQLLRKRGVLVGENLYCVLRKRVSFCLGQARRRAGGGGGGGCDALSVTKYGISRHLFLSRGLYFNRQYFCEPSAQG